MSALINVQIDENKALEIYKEKVAEVIKDYDADLVYWDSKELCKRTCMSWKFIQEQFFYDPRFIKTKVGSKWFFPAKEAREFLQIWIQEKGARG
ncbi:group-specific protein [Terribacillus sp. AE2B 122]|uniref:group-specific protein n=1 Tax=Terribacillus sp. AE2B 122 TaxID=1331902 RepID=UPI003530437F